MNFKQSRVNYSRERDCPSVRTLVSEFKLLETFI
jgi:hypothetical protein